MTARPFRHGRRVHWRCRPCGQVFKSRQAWSVHHARTHGIHSQHARAVRKRRQQVREAGQAIGRPPPEYECMCGELFHFRGDLAAHRRAHNHYPPGQDH